MVNKKLWEDFKKSGLLWFVNMLLHTFGWAIVYDIEDEKITNVYPARVKFRGFPEQSNTEGYIKVSQYMKDNIDELLEESKS